MARHEELQLIQHIARKLDENPVANFGYTQAAFDNDIVDGVEVFDKRMEQNIPKETMTDYDPRVRDKGIRSQSGSIPRMGWNHYVGRLSYNVNKLVQKIKDFFTFIAEWMAHNGAEYDPTARYKTGDVCFTVSQMSGVKVYTWYIRHSLYPATIAGIGPEAGAHWEEMQSATSSSALLPFAAPGYRHKYAIADLTGSAYDRNTYYPVVTAFQDFTEGILDGKDDILQVLIEAYCSGTVAGQANPCRADLIVTAAFTGFAASSADTILRNVFIDNITGGNVAMSGSPIGYSKLPKGRQAVIWLRGGGTYALWNSFGSVFEIQESAYDNGYDAPVLPGARVFMPVYGTVHTRVETPDAVLQTEAPNLGQVTGSLPLPKALTAGTQLDSLRKPGWYTALDAGTANGILQLPVPDPGPFSLLVRGDKEGATVTVQQLTALESGDEYTRVLSGNTVMIPWYLSGSPDRLRVVGYTGLYVVDIDENTGNALVHYDGREEPALEIDFQTGHLLWHSPDDPQHILDLGKIVGASVTGIAVDYQTGTSGTAVPAGAWVSAPPAPQQGKFLWTRIRVTVVDNGKSSVTTAYSTSYYGIDGTNISITGVEIAYQISASGTVIPAGAWVSAPPAPQQGKFLWTRTRLNILNAGTALQSDGYSVGYYAVDAPTLAFEIDDNAESATYGHLLLTRT
jgi:hypothetical protein